MRSGRALLDSGWEITKAIVDEYNRDRVSGLASEIAFWTVLSLFPALLILGAALGWMDAVVGRGVAADAESEVVALIERMFDSEEGGLSDAARQLFDRPNTGVLTASIVFALFSISSGFNAMVRAFDVAYDITADRPWHHARLTALALAVGTLAVLAVAITALVVGPFFGLGDDLGAQVGAGSWFETLWNLALVPGAFVILVLWIAALYHFATLHTTPYRWDLPGALLAAVSWVLATVGFRIYIAVAAQGNAILGVLGGALSLLTWVYLLCVGLVLGAEVNQVLARRHGVSVEVVAPPTVRQRAARAVEWIRHRRQIADVSVDRADR